MHLIIKSPTKTIVGVQPPLESTLQDFANYPLEKLEDLADALSA